MQTLPLLTYYCVSFFYYRLNFYMEKENRLENDKESKRGCPDDTTDYMDPYRVIFSNSAY